MINKNIIIAGSGFTGAYIARNLAEAGWKVRVLERRNHIAGNMYDKIDEETGCLVHEYGPHVFHTNDDDIWNWLNKYSKFTPFILRTQVLFEGYKDHFTCSFGFHTIEKLYSKEKASLVIQALKEEFPNKNKVAVTDILQSNNELIKDFANILWEEDYKPYTAKQWGLDPDEVDQNIFKRVPVYLSYFDRYYNDKYEALPSDSYTALFEPILAHDNIEVELCVDALKMLRIEDSKVYYDNKETKFVFTGAVDELFNYEFGQLDYRSLVFKKEINKNDKCAKSGDPCVDIYPNSRYEYTRITNYGKLPIQNKLDYQISSKEYSMGFDINKTPERYYPTLKKEDKIKLKGYNNKAKGIQGLYLSGRLADYKYYNMDQALIAARETLKLITKDTQ